MPERIRKYNENGSDLVEIDKHILKNMDIHLVVDDLSVVSDNNLIQHDSVKLAKIIVKIVCDNMDMKDSSSALDYYTVKSKMQGVNKKKKKNILFRNVKVVMPKRRKKVVAEGKKV